MIKLTIDKGELGQQLWPLSINDTLVFSIELGGTPGLFGIRNNNLNFIPMEDLSETITISIPENLDEVMGFLGSAEYILNRIMMTPNIIVTGYTNESKDKNLRSEVMAIFNNFSRFYHQNDNVLDRIKNNW